MVKTHCDVYGAPFIDVYIYLVCSPRSSEKPNVCLVVFLPLPPSPSLFSNPPLCVSLRSQRSRWESFSCIPQWSGSIHIHRSAASEKTPKWPCLVSCTLACHCCTLGNWALHIIPPTPLKTLADSSNTLCCSWDNFFFLMAHIVGILSAHACSGVCRVHGTATLNSVCSDTISISSWKLRCWYILTGFKPAS